MAYTGKKPTDFVDVTQTKDFTVTEDLTVDTNTLHVDSANNNVGIGTSSPTQVFEVNNGSNTAAAIKVTDTSGYTELFFGDSADDDAGYISYRHATNHMALGVNAAERMRIDSSGNVLVGTTSTIPQTGDHGFVARANGYTIASVDDARVMLLNRDTSDGEILKFSKDNTTVGSIGNDGANRLIVNSENTTGYLAVDGAVKFRWRTNDFIPHDNGTKDLGTSATRWKDLYLGGGVYLGGTGSANKLDDYEEGTWTPTFGSGSFGLSSNFTYTKIGRTVHITGYLAIPSGLPSSTLTISGLPFAGNTNFQMSLLWYNGSSSTIAAAYLSGGSTSLQVRPIGGGPNTFTELSVQMTYITS